VTIHKIKVRNIQSLKEASSAIKEIGSDPESIPIMSPKMVHRVIQIEDVLLQDAIIIKQDMLSIGGEVAVPKKTFELHQEKATILVSGTIQQHRELILKLQRHYPRIQKISYDLENIMEKIL
jgi:dihydropteroate synthase